jgi:hypothetical protein
MGLRELNPQTRRRLRLHGALLTLWCLLVGVATSALLLHAAGLRSPPLRFALTAVVMYGVGMVLGTRFWLSHFATSVDHERGVLGRADLQQQLAFDAEQADLRAWRERIGRRFDAAEALGNLAGLFEAEGVALLFIVPALVFSAVALLMLAGLLPFMLVDGLAGLLAEVAIQFVFGALVARRLLRPRGHSEVALEILGRTWIAGLLLVVCSAAAGWALVRFAPGAQSFAEALHR